MATYHLSEDGVPRHCSAAPGNCRLIGAPHSEAISLDEARAWAEKVNAERYATVPKGLSITQSQTDPTTRDEQELARLSARRDELAGDPEMAGAVASIDRRIGWIQNDIAEERAAQEAETERVASQPRGLSGSIRKLRDLLKG